MRPNDGSSGAPRPHFFPDACYAMLRHATSCAITLLLGLGIPLTASAQEVPSPQEARRFLDFYYNGQEGVVLAETQICTTIPREGDQAYGCVGEVARDAVQTGRQYYLRMVFVVPQGVDRESITVQYNHEGAVQNTDEVVVTSSIRYRTWTVFTLPEPGVWQLQIARATNTEPEELRTLDLRAQDGGE
jgi:hypothetical protein